jgi:hypothetical protein
MRKFLCGILPILLLLAFSAKSQVANYSFSQSAGTYTPITGGTVIVSATDPAPGGNDSAAMDDFAYASYALPFSFYFGGNSYSSFQANSNGYIAFGGGTSTSTTPVSSTVYSGVIAPFAKDLLGLSTSVGTTTSGSNVITAVGSTSLAKVGATIQGSGIPAATTITAFTANTITLSAAATSTNTGTFISWTTGEIRFQVTGTAPNRTVVIQFSGISQYSSGSTDAGLNSNINFQIQLAEGGGNPANHTITVVYGNSQFSGASTTLQTGIRGLTTADFNNRTTTTTWSASTAGAANSATMTWSPTVAPAIGQTYVWTPAALCTTPAAQPTALVLTPTVSSVGGSFTAASPAPTGYLVVRTNTNVAPVPANGTVYTTGANAIGYIESVGTSTTFTSSLLNSATTYYYWVFSYTTGATCTGPVYLTAAPLTASATTNACTVTGVKTIPGNYPTLTAAMADLTTNGLAGAVVLELQAGYTGAGETYPIVAGAFACASSTNTVTVRPATGATGLSITSASTTSTFDLNGARFVTIDGRPGGTGSTADLKITNTSTSGIALRIFNDASNNTVTYCDLQSQSTTSIPNPTSTTQAGVVYFGAANATNLLGNDNNTISFSNIHATAGGNPTGGIISSGTSTTDAAYNDNNTITNNNIYDFFSAGNASMGIKLDAGNNAWNITNNNFYQTASRTYTTANAHRAIWITPGTSSTTTANGFTISGNFIGGNAPGATGTYTMLGTVANVFWGMDISVGLGTATSVQNNTITNLAINTSGANAGFIGISQNQGNVNMGTVTGNTIGSASATGAITVTSTATGGGTVLGYRITGGTGSVAAISNNSFGGVTTVGSATFGQGINGILVSGGATVNVSNNVIGSLTTANSLNASTASTGQTQSVIGVNIATTSAGTITISNNTVANITNAYGGTGNGLTDGIVIASSGTPVIAGVTGNTVRNLMSASLSTGNGTNCAILGIASSNSNAAGCNITGNTIHSLRLNAVASTFAAVQATGLFYTGSTSGASTISKNYIHSFDVVNAVADTQMVFTGIDFASATATIANNMIRLGIQSDGSSLTTGMLIRGISSNSSSAANNIYFNSIYIGGTGVVNAATMQKNTYAFIRTSSSGTYDVRNNIFFNARSNASGTTKHYSVFLTTAATGFSPDYNFYLANGTGGVFAFNGTTDIAAYTPVLPDG